MKNHICQCLVSGHLHSSLTGGDFEWKLFESRYRYQTIWLMVVSAPNKEDLTEGEGGGWGIEPLVKQFLFTMPFIKTGRRQVSSML